MTDKPTDEIEAWKIERDKLYELIGHGDFEHRTWLYRELTNFFSSRHSAAKEEVERLRGCPIGEKTANLRFNRFPSELTLVP